MADQIILSDSPTVPDPTKPFFDLSFKLSMLTKDRSFLDAASLFAVGMMEVRQTYEIWLRAQQEVHSDCLREGEAADLAREEYDTSEEAQRFDEAISCARRCLAKLQEIYNTRENGSWNERLLGEDAVEAYRQLCTDIEISLAAFEKKLNDWAHRLYKFDLEGAA